MKNGKEGESWGVGRNMWISLKLFLEDVFKQNLKEFLDAGIF